MKKFRNIISTGVLFLIVIIFLDLHAFVSDSFISWVLFFQFIPSLLKFSVSAVAGAAGFIVVLCLTFLAGRIYCSFLCPLGISIDIISRLASASSKKKAAYSKPRNCLRYGILILTIAGFATGTMSLISLVDPYSHFGRIMTVLVQPLFIFLTNGLSRILEALDIYWISPFDQTDFSLSLLFLAGFFAGLIIIISVKKGRLYCNSLCPVGAFLGIIAKKALLKPFIDPKKCTACGKCESVCKASCIDSKKKHIDVSRCVACFNCLGICPQQSISFVSHRKKSLTFHSAPVDLQKRRLMIMLSFFIGGLSKKSFGNTRPVVYIKNKIPVQKKYPVIPPGAKSIEHFSGKCTACYLCVTACPGKVIQAGFNNFGSNRGLLMPAMLNQKGYCSFNCNRCGRICPTGAILPLAIEEKKQVQIGRVVFIRENCIVITQKSDCGACSEHCPTKAVFMVLENKLRVPAVNADICLGCGACEYACPAQPYKAIYVEGNPVHLRAKKPKIKKQDLFGPDRDFPF